ncbi:MAG: hypothetical protein Q4E21_01270 [Clostridia bacterium]|nr:hypothetical protein [Clostridia bacterium]
MKKRTKKTATAILTAAVCIAAAIGITVGCIYAENRPKTTFDFAQKTGSVTNGASGFLYGFAEPDIPTKEMAESIGVSTLSTKTLGGLQHPVGDVDQVADTFFSAGGKEIIVYTQDMYDTWYYQFDSLEQYHERVRQTVTQTAKKDYADNVIYCIYNEMDNGQWYGDFKEYENRQKTYEAWKATYALVRSIDADAKIGGPSYCSYKSEYIKEFLEYCKSENCLPDTMIWHELGTNSLYMWEEHFADYDALCQELGIEKMPVCITEYGLMSTNGIPGESVKWISRIESVKCEGCVAYWRLANNLSDVAADDTTPNSNWWAYFWYNAMSGETVQSTSKDLFQSNMGKFLTRQSKELKFKGFTGLSTIDEAKGEIQILAGGSNRDSTIVLENLDKTDSFKTVEKVFVTAEYVDYKGLSGEVSAPKIKFAKYYDVADGKVRIDLDDILYTQCYHITVTPYADGMTAVSEEIPETEIPMSRYEAENATLFGTATADSNVAYAASEYTLVKANSAETSGVEFTVAIPKDGSYSLDLVYGNGANNIQYNADGSQADKGERTDIELLVSVDGEETENYLPLSSTLKDDFTNVISYTVDLKQGKHTIRFTLPENKEFQQTVSFDFLDVTPQTDTDRNTAYLGFTPYCVQNVAKSDENNTAFWALPDANGYYAVQIISKTAPTALTLNGTRIDTVSFTSIDNAAYRCILYLRHGLNSLSVNVGNAAVTNITWYDAGQNDNTADYFAEDFTLSGNAKLEDLTVKTMTAMLSSQINVYIDGVSSDTDGAATVTYTAPQAGYYQFTFTYANNEEGGVHDYNVDLVERYITLTVNNEDRGNYYFRNTYSWETLKTKVITVYLVAGENTITFSNNGSYQFNGKTAFAPHITKLSVSPITVSES